MSAFDKEKICDLTNLSDSNIILMDSVDSTNTYLKNIAPHKGSHEFVVIANSQTNGRGRSGKCFFSPPETGIYMSVLLATDKIALNAHYITIAAGVAVCRALRSLGCNQPLIKWVNDIFLNGKKVCGILAEKVSNTGYVVVGIGINVDTPQGGFPEELQKIAGAVCPQYILRNEIVAEVLNEFRNIYNRNDKKALIDEYKRYSLILGKKISFLRNGTSLSGTATDIDINGNLVVKTNIGESIVLNSGEVSLESKNFVE